MNRLTKIYKRLLKKHGHQGWWPLINKGGYHPRDYNLPVSDNDRFEIAIGAILTQNTNWNNVKKALINLNNNSLLNAEQLLECDEERVKKCIKPAGYYNQKTKYLKNFTRFYTQLKNPPTRSELLNIKGIGKETADSILLYAYKQPSFVIDAYTKRIFKKIGVLKGDESYEKIKELFENNLPKDYKLYQEYHALIVEEGKIQD